MGEIALFTQYGTSSKAIHSRAGVPVLTMGNIQDGVIVRTNEKRIPETSEELPALFLKRFNLLYNRTNSAELVGKTGIYLGDDDVLTFALVPNSNQCESRTYGSEFPKPRELQRKVDVGRGG